VAEAVEAAVAAAVKAVEKLLKEKGLI